MASLNLKSLMGTLNETCRRALNDAAGIALSRTNYNVEVEHWLLQLLDSSGADLSEILTYFGVELSRLKRDLTRVIDGLKTGNSRTPALSPNVVSLAREAWLIASLDGAPKTRSGYLLQALLSDETLARLGARRRASLKKSTPTRWEKTSRESPGHQPRPAPRFPRLRKARAMRVLPRPGARPHRSINSPSI